ncbi:hypothetical protein D3Z36_13515 [Lachnospiraceae bacterium]|nr:hypothetical protein [Lachnospiraceae bacterium]
MKNYPKQWLNAAGIRAAKTMAQTALSMLTVGQAVIDVNWLNVLSVSAMAGIVSILTSLAGLPEINATNTIESEER